LAGGSTSAGGAGEERSGRNGNIGELSSSESEIPLEEGRGVKLISKLLFTLREKPAIFGICLKNVVK
jgi:hypothetical protein